jgi:hypothetical protein
MFIESEWSSHSPAKSEMPGISLFAEMMRGNRVTIDISPLCGDDQFPSFREPIEGFLRQPQMTGSPATSVQSDKFACLTISRAHS